MIASQISEDPAEMENASEPTEDFAWEVPEPRPRLNRAGRVRRMRRRSRRGGVGEGAFRGGAVRGGPRDRTEAYEEEGGEDSGRPVLRGQRRGEPYRVRGRFFRGPRRAYPRRDPDGRTQRGLWRGPRLSQTQLEPTQPMIKEFGHKFDYYVKDDESFSSSVEPYDPATSKILMIQNDIVPFKDFSTDPKSIQLFTAMVEEATIHPSLPGQTFEEVVEDLVTAMWHAAETDRLSTQQSSSSASSYSSDDADDSFDNGPGNKSGNYLATQSSASVLQSDATLNLRLKLDKKYQSNADLATPFSASARQRDASLKVGTKADRNLNRRYCLKSMNAGAEGGHQRDGQSSTELSSARVQFQEPKPLTPCGCGWVEDRDWLEFKDKMEATAPKRDTTDIESSDEPFFIDSRAKAKNLNRLQRHSAQYYRRRGREIERYYSEKLASFSGDGVPFHDNCLDVSGKPKDILETQDQSSRFCDKRKQTVLSSDSPRCSRRVSHEGNTCKVTVVLPASGSNNSHNLDLSYQRQALRLDKLLSTSPLQLVFQKFHSCQQVSTSHHDGLGDNSSSKPGIHRTPKPLPTNDDDNNSNTGIHKTPKTSSVNNDNNSNTGIHRTPKTPPTNDDGDYNRSAKVKPDPPSGGSSDSSESSSSSSSEESSSDDKSSADSQIHMDQEFTVDLAVAQIFTHHIGTNPQRALQGTNFSDEYGIMFDDMWLCLLCEISSVRKRHIGLARLESSMYLIPSCQEARFLIIIISNPAEKGTRSGLEAGRYFATLMCSPDFRQRMIKANTVDLMRELLIEESMMLERAHKFEAEKELEMFDTIKGGPGFSLKELFYPPFAGIRADLARRIPHYLSDYSDGVLGFKTLQKLFAAVLCLYFACILPLIALGYLLSTSTKGRIGPKSLVFAQSVSSIIYGIFGGHAVVIVMISTPLVLYAKIIHSVASDLDLEFPALYSLTCMFASTLLILYSIFNLANIMNYFTKSIGETLDVFVAVTFAADVIMALIANFQAHYFSEACVKPDLKLEDTCRRDTSMLYVLIVCCTLVMGLLFNSFTMRPFFSASIREAISDYALPLAVLFSTVIGSFFFSAVFQEPFMYDSDEVILIIPDLKGVPAKAYVMALLLSIPLSLLIFTDHSTNAVAVNSPVYKLRKGSAYHLDLLVIGFLNLLLALFMLPLANGASPHSPLHLKAMADIDNRIEQGASVQRLIRVRETRLTGILMGCFIGMSLFLLPLPLNYIPKAVLEGMLIFLAIVSLNGNDFIERLTLLFKDQATFPANSTIRQLPLSILTKFSALQLVQLALITFLSYSPFVYTQMLFPIMIILLFPIRHMVIVKFFRKKQLAELDGD